VLTVAAVAREGIPRELCEATQVVQGKGEAEVRDAITRLLQCQMLAERGEGLELGSSFLRTLVLDELPPTAVRSQHRHLARAAERYFGQVGATALEARAEMLAHHYLQAGEVLDAARQLLVAAYRLRQQGDLLTAELVLDRGERLLNEQQVVNRATRLRALRALRAEVRAGLGNLKGALENARWVLDSAREAGHAEMEARAWQAVARAQIRSGKVKEAREAARSACDTWQAMGRKVELARARALLGEADALGGDFDLGEKELADAVQSASTMQDVDGERTALLALAGVHLARWRPEQALERLQQLQRIPGAETLEVKMARLPREAHALLMTGRFDAARQLSEELREAVHRLSSRWPLARTRAAAASAATWLALGDLVAAEKRLKSAEQGALRDGYLVTWVRIQGWRAELALERQEPDRAIGLLERGESAAAAAHLEPLRRELMATRAWAVFERGDHEQASGLLKQLVQPGVQVSEQVVIDGMLLVAALRIARGEHEAAERTSREAVERAEQVGLWEQRLLASHLLGQALAHTLSSEAALWVAKSRRQIETVVKDWPAVSAERFRCRRRVRQVLASGTGE
jgi:tetratricopeptide (TPR) repeat protein